VRPLNARLHCQQGVGAAGHQQSTARCSTESDSVSQSRSESITPTSSATSNLSEDSATGNNTCAQNHETSSRGPALFHAVVRMMALVEGGIVEPADPEFGFAVNDAMYGIIINKTHRLVYTRQYGLRLLDFID